MYRFEYGGGGSHTRSESSSTASSHPSSDSDSDRRPTPEEELQAYKRLLPKSPLYFFSDEEFLEKRRVLNSMRTKSAPRKPSDEDLHIAQRVAIGKRPAPESRSSRSDSLRSRNNRKSSPSPPEYTIEIQKKALSKPTAPPQERFRTDQSVISAKALARLAKTYGFSHASVICAREHQ